MKHITYTHEYTGHETYNFGLSKNPGLFLLRSRTPHQHCHHGLLQPRPLSLSLSRKLIGDSELVSEFS